MAFFRGVNKFQHLEIVPGGTLKGLGLIDPNGRTYYVNNITGSPSAGGLSWKDPFAEVSQAITASEAYRVKHATNNEFVRNRIIVQGTALAYAEVTSFPNFCDVIGIGANPYGNGAGIARIGLDSYLTEGAGGGIYSAGDCRGCYFYNLQFQAIVDHAPIKVANIFRTTFENCAFFGAGQVGGKTTAGFQITGSAGGLILKNCHMGTNSSKTTIHTIGLLISGTYFHHCRVEDCTIGGTTAGIQVAVGCINAWGSTVKGCYIGDIGDTCLIGVDDNAVPGLIVYMGNYIKATTKLDLENDGDARAIGNMAANGFVAAT